MRYLTGQQNRFRLYLGSCLIVILGCQQSRMPVNTFSSSLSSSATTSTSTGNPPAPPVSSPKSPAPGVQGNVSVTSTLIDNTTKLCVTISGAVVQAGAQAVESPCSGASNQIFVLNRQADDYSLLQDSDSGNCLAPQDDATAVGSLIVTAACNVKDTAQEYFPVYQGTGQSFAILNRKSGLCLQKTSVDAPLSLADCSSTLPLTFTAAGLSLPGPNQKPAYVAGGIGRAGSTPGNPTGTFTTTISGQTFNGSVSLYGVSNTLFVNNVIINGTLKIDGATNLYVKGNTIENGEIWFRDTSLSNNVVIDGNEIYGSGADGIQLYQDTTTGQYVNPTNIQIINNEIHDNGTNYPGSALYYGIYDMVPGVLIENNLLYHNKDAVSIRNSGTIKRNVFRNNLAGAAIFYEPNHAAPAGSTLLIENNVIDSQVINESGALPTNRGLIGLGNSPDAPVTHYVVRFNTIVLENQQSDGTGTFWNILTQFAFSSVMTGEIYGNLLINLLNINYVGFNAATYSSSNYKNSSLAGVGFLNANFEIDASSPASALETKETNYPTTDRNLKPRPGSNRAISAGAYQPN